MWQYLNALVVLLLLSDYNVYIYIFNDLKGDAISQTCKSIFSLHFQHFASDIAPSISLVDEKVTSDSRCQSYFRNTKG